MRRPDPEMAEGVGMWSHLMTAMGLLAVLTNTAIICFTEGTLQGRQEACYRERGSVIDTLYGMQLLYVRTQSNIDLLPPLNKNRMLLGVLG